MVPLSRLRKFYTKHGSRPEERWRERTGLIAKLVPLTEAGLADELEVGALVDQIEVLNTSIGRHDEAIRDSTNSHVNPLGATSITQ